MNSFTEQMVIEGKKFLSDYFVLHTELNENWGDKKINKAKSEPREFTFFLLSTKLTLVNFKNH